MQFPGFGMMTCTAIDSCDPWQVRKALHVDVPAKNGKEWAICGGIQYSSDFGSLLPHCEWLPSF